MRIVAAFVERKRSENETKPKTKRKMSDAKESKVACLLVSLGPEPTKAATAQNGVNKTAMAPERKLAPHKKKGKLQTALESGCRVPINMYVCALHV